MPPTPVPVVPTRAPGAPWAFVEAALFLGVSARHLHRLARANKVKSIKLGHRRLIPDSEVQRLAREGA